MVALPYVLGGQETGRNTFFEHVLGPWNFSINTYGMIFVLRILSSHSLSSRPLFYQIDRSCLCRYRFYGYISE